MNKRNSGITLVALVITIIVLLILAGVSIALVVGDNGVLSRSQEAKAGSIVAEEKEQVNLAYSSALTKNLGDTVTAENLQAELDESVGNGKTTVIENGNNLSVLFNETGHSYNVNKGRITGGDYSLTDLEKLRIYFATDEWWDEENDNFKDMEPIPDASTSISEIGDGYSGWVIKYNGNYYEVNVPTVELLTDLGKLQMYFLICDGNIYDDSENKIFRAIEPILDANTSIRYIGYIHNFIIIQYKNNYYEYYSSTNGVDIPEIEIDFNTFGVYDYYGTNILVTPSTPEDWIHSEYRRLPGSGFSYMEPSRPYDEEYVYEVRINNGQNHRYYNMAGEVVDNIIWLD